MKITVVIPAKNEEHNIEKVIKKSLRYCDEVLVIDGNSSDNTVEVSQKAGAKTHMQTSKGKGGAIVEAGHLVSDGLIVFIDADQSHDPEDIPRLAEPIINGDADLVIGSRMLGGSDELFTGINEFIRLVGSHIITLLISKRFRHVFTDSQNGYRAISVKALRSLPLKQASFTIETEMCIEALRGGLKVLEVASHEYRRTHGESNISALKLGPLYVWVTIAGIAKRRTRPRALISSETKNLYKSSWK